MSKRRVIQLLSFVFVLVLLLPPVVSADNNVNKERTFKGTVLDNLPNQIDVKKSNGNKTEALISDVIAEKSGESTITFTGTVLFKGRSIPVSLIGELYQSHVNEQDVLIKGSLDSSSELKLIYWKIYNDAKESDLNGQKEYKGQSVMSLYLFNGAFCIISF